MLKKLPWVITLASIIGGVFIAILFGINENLFKDRIRIGLTKNLSLQEITDPLMKEEKTKIEAEKSWRYYQRFHFHSTGIAAMTLGLLFLLTRIQAPQIHATITSLLISIGGFLYPFVWLFAGIYGPEMGREAAKEAFAFFGYMGGAFLLGCCYTLFLLLRYDMKESTN